MLSTYFKLALPNTIQFNSIQFKERAIRGRAGGLTSLTDNAFRPSALNRSSWSIVLCSGCYNLQIQAKNRISLKFNVCATDGWTDGNTRIGRFNAGYQMAKKTPGSMAMIGKFQTHM